MARRSTAVHEIAATGFANEAEAYERARPSYPPDAVAWLSNALGLAPGVRAVDLAAGTGKLTRLLMPSGAALLAVEPVDGMRAQLVRALPGAPALAATAEALPFRDASIDAITVAQAFHWFDVERAPAELHRVLRPGGRIGIIWNNRDRGVPWVDAVWSIMDGVEQKAPWRSEPDQRRSATSLAPPRFGPLRHAEFSHEHVVSPADMVDRVRSVSHVAALPPAQRDEVLDRVRSLLAADPATAGRDELAVPYRVDVYWTERLS
ncbi:MAG TPA: class I SAM-dependent methyltransferase [Gaiellaceae bacterium]|nr:class I SAM-dependent methyltransferase [Gaiellaceae bacterium]